MNEIEASKARRVREFARGCNGSEHFYRHMLCKRLLYTDGVKEVATICGAWWLVDAIASYVATNYEVNRELFQVWTLKVHAVCGRTMLACTNGNDDVPVVSQEIPYTDFPSELMPFKLFCEAGGGSFVLMLPEER